MRIRDLGDPHSVYEVVGVCELRLAADNTAVHVYSEVPYDHELPPELRIVGKLYPLDPEDDKYVCRERDVLAVYRLRKLTTDEIVEPFKEAGS